MLQFEEFLRFGYSLMFLGGVCMDVLFWIMPIVGILSFGAVVWYDAWLGKKISAEEKEAGRVLMYEINSFAGSANGLSEEDEK